jgi:hypothetical protein
MPERCFYAPHACVSCRNCPDGSRPRARKSIRVEDLSHHPFVTDFPSGGQLNLLIRSAEIHIVGHEKHELVVRVGGGDGSESTDINATCDRSGNSANLRVSGGPDNDAVVTVEVPRQSNLVVRISGRRRRPGWDRRRPRDQSVRGRS